MNMLPLRDTDGPQRYRAAYIIHLRDIWNDITESSTGGDQTSTAAIGLVSVQESQVYGIPLPDLLTLPDKDASRDPVLKMEMGYMLLPESWGKGYCTEAVAGVLESYKKATNFWQPYKGVYLNLIVGEDNLASCKVAEKAGFQHLGLHEWPGEPVFLAGAWRDCRVLVFGIYLARPKAIEI
jgi:Acetyltransferase (GNAT) domain